MPTVEKLKEKLTHFGVDISVIDSIFEGFENVTNKSTKKEKVRFFSHAMNKLDEKLGPDAKGSVLDGCACSLGGFRARKIKEFARKHGKEKLREKISLIGNTFPNKNIIGNPVLNADNTITAGIFYSDGNKYKCACPNFHNEKLTTTISKTYCYCCAGHFRHHYQNAFGVTLKTKEVLSSPLDSFGEKPCQFLFEIVNDDSKAI
jgi:hypothetical protein